MRRSCRSWSAATGADFAEVKPILDAMGTTVVLVGPAGSGQTVKAANQLIVAGNYELVAEAIVFLRAYGVDTEAALTVLAGGLAGSTVMNRKGASMLAGEFKPGFRIDLHHKDMGIVARRGPGEGRRHPARRGDRPADRRAARTRRRRAGPLGPAARGRAAVGRRTGR